MKEKHITRDQALAALAVACSTLTLNGKLMHESKEAQALIAAAAALGALNIGRAVTASTQPMLAHILWMVSRTRLFEVKLIALLPERWEWQVLDSDV